MKKYALSAWKIGAVISFFSDVGLGPGLDGFFSPVQPMYTVPPRKIAMSTMAPICFAFMG